MFYGLLFFFFTAKRGRLICCCLILFAAPLLRTLAYLYKPAVHRAMRFQPAIHGRCDRHRLPVSSSLKELENSPIVSRIIHLRCFFVIPMLSVIMYTALKFFPAFYFAGGKSIALACIAATLWRVMHVRDTAFRFLDPKPLVKVGVLELFGLCVAASSS